MIAPFVLDRPAEETEDSAKRRQIVEGARTIFRVLGFDAASMGEIAKAAGVSKGTLYVYFKDKDELFQAIVAKNARSRQRAFSTSMRSTRILQAPSPAWALLM
jgi:AcrR family transcriptional regulator